MHTISAINQTITWRLRAAAPKIILVLFVIQPLLDALSFWQEQLGFGNTLTLLLRFVMLLCTVLLGFLLSRHRRRYLLLFAACALLMLLHGLSCWRIAQYAPQLGSVTLSSAISDLANQLRIYQLPLFTCCFITLLQEGEKTAAAVKKGFVLNFIIILALTLLSVVTDTDPHTYANKGLGVCGWFNSNMPNAQSAIICMIAPMALYQSWSSGKKWLFGLTAALLTAQLYLFATRLSYLAAFAVLLGFLIVLLTVKRLSRTTAVILLLCAALCAAGYTISPMYQNQSLHAEILAEEQADMDELIAAGEEKYGADDPRCLEEAYAKYCLGLVERFGIEEVAEEFNYSRDAATVINWRSCKKIYNQLLREELPPIVRWFGVDLRLMTDNGFIYDAENDFHALYYLCGGAGLAAMLLFLLYFAIIIVSALLRDFRRYFTPEAGACGIAILLGLGHAVLTAGVLRRPNSSFYLSALLALAYYLLRIKSYDSALEKELPHAQ